MLVIYYVWGIIDVCMFCNVNSRILVVCENIEKKVMNSEWNLR